MLPSKRLCAAKYHAIVVIDIGEDLPEPFKDVLVLFVELGGAIAFCGPDGKSHIKIMKELYKEIEWEASSYYRSLWGPCKMETVNEMFGPIPEDTRASSNRPHPTLLSRFSSMQSFVLPFCLRAAAKSFRISFSSSASVRSFVGQH
jgi:hypothetical protein